MRDIADASAVFGAKARLRGSGARFARRRPLRNRVDLELRLPKLRGRTSQRRCRSARPASRSAAE
jgi:hypothetical protein